MARHIVSRILMRPRSCLIVIENLPAPFDRHVWQEARALRDAGWRVAVISPTGPQPSPSRERIEGIEIYRHPLPVTGKGFKSYIVEYATALFHEIRLIGGIYFTQRFDVLHACNPPDFILLAAVPLKILGVKFVFDHHDLTPELYEVRFGTGIMYRIILILEMLSFRLADLVLSSNETFRELALTRGGKSPETVTVVRTIPDAHHLMRVAPDKTARRGRRTVLGYLGIIGFQDGLDHFVEAVGILRREMGLVDFQAVIVGDGPALATVRSLAASLQIEDAFSFTGYLSSEQLWAHLSDFDVGIIPDPVNAFNDKLSMNKVFEYSVLGIPSVSYPLRETVRLLGTAGTYARENTPRGLAEAIATLLEDDSLRQRRGREAQAIAAAEFDWERERWALVEAYDRLIPRSGP